MNAIKVYVPPIPSVKGLEGNDCGQYLGSARKAASLSHHWGNGINTSDALNACVAIHLQGLEIDVFKQGHVTLPFLKFRFHHFGLRICLVQFFCPRCYFFFLGLQLLP